MAERNYYEILGVDRKASDDDIKKAYRKLVRKYHPDVSKDPEAVAKTSEINIAYETLHNKEKRAEYDDILANPFRHGGQQNGGSHNGYEYQQYDFDPSHFSQNGAFGSGDFRFDDLFSAFGSSNRHGFHQNHTDPMRGEDQHAELVINIAASYQGVQRNLSLDMPTLNAQGQMTYARKTLNVKIPAGIIEGQQIRLSGQGLPGFNGGAAGDLYLKISFRNEENLYVQNRKDVYQRINVAPWTAALGGKTDITTPAGALSVNIPANSHNGQKMRLKGKGIPAKDAGDLYLLINIVLPQASTEADRAAWQTLASHYAAFQPQNHE
ncbi:DnaJ C-terminal domain-containing protein [Snodgrassella communis]|uniref:DnaJ C-terminal domain-containing protein n=1 Tax=Snodgrassella communis TaxID=2946699 RepID=UPI001EF5A610|nr:DnaJ C-terminal domain-containing protein [Snodgrassella communis]